MISENKKVCGHSKTGLALTTNEARKVYDAAIESSGEFTLMLHRHDTLAHAIRLDSSGKISIVALSGSGLWHGALVGIYANVFQLKSVYGL